MLSDIFSNFAPSPHDWWYGFFKDFAGPISTVSAASVAAGLAWFFQWRMWKAADSQVKNAKYKLRLELFDRRYAVYEATVKLLAPFEHDAKQASKFIYEIAKAEFLFQSDVVEFTKAVIDLEATRRVLGTLSNISDSDREKLLIAMQTMQSMSTDVNSKFRRYLSLKDVK